MTFEWKTADGFFAGPDGKLDWVVPDEEQGKAAARDIPNFDTALLGCRTYAIFEEFWGHVVVDDAGTVPDPHRPGRRSPEHGAIAIALNKMSKLVFSKTLKVVSWRNSRLVRELDPPKSGILKMQPGKDVIIFGSGSIVSQLRQHGLIEWLPDPFCHD